MKTMITLGLVCFLAACSSGNNGTSAVQDAGDSATSTDTATSTDADAPQASDDGEAATATLTCTAKQDCETYSVEIFATTAKILVSNVCALSMLPKTLVGSYTKISQSVDGDANVTYSSADGDFQLVDSGRFGNTLNATLNKGTDAGATLSQAVCQ